MLARTRSNFEIGVREVHFPDLRKDLTNSGRTTGNPIFSDHGHSVRRPPEQMLVAVLGHPLGAGQVALPAAPRAIGFSCRIDVQHDTRHLVPIRTLRICIEEAEVSGEVLPVVGGKDIRVGSLVGNGWLGWWLGHNQSRPHATVERDATRREASKEAVITCLPYNRTKCSRWDAVSKNVFHRAPNTHYMG